MAEKNWPYCPHCSKVIGWGGPLCEDCGKRIHDSCRGDCPEANQEAESQRNTPAGFEVMAKQCATCIYRKDSFMDLERLENQVRDHKGFGFAGYRVCHNSTTACCRGFWNAHKDEFQLGQLAQRLDAVIYMSKEDAMKCGKCRVNEAETGAYCRSCLELEELTNEELEDAEAFWDRITQQED